MQATTSTQFQGRAMQLEAPAREQPPDIRDAQGALAATVDTLTMAVGELLKRIQPVVNDTPRAAGNGHQANIPAGNCEISRSIREQVSKLTEIEEHVREALSGLQL